MAAYDRIVQTTFTVVDRATAAVKPIVASLKNVEAAAGAAALATSRLGDDLQRTLLRNARRFSRDMQKSMREAFTLEGFGRGMAFLAYKATDVGQAGSTAFSSIKFGALKALTAVTALATGFATLATLAARPIAKLNDEYESNQANIAGTLQALGAAPTFADGLGKASAIMERIRVSAAALPGEAEDYVKIFTHGLPALQGAVKGSLADKVAFSNQFAAITATRGIDAAQAGRDLMLMLRSGRGGAGAATKSYNELLPFMRAANPKFPLRARDFNELSQEKRAELMAAGMAKLQDRLDHAKNSFDALKGGVISNVKHITRLGGLPAFNAMKDGMRAFNDAIADSNGNLTELGKNLIAVGQVVSTVVAGGFKQVAVWAEQSYGWVKKMADSPVGKQLQGAVGQVASNIGRASSVFEQGNNGMAGAAMALAAIGDSFAPGVLMAAAVIGQLAANTEFVNATLGTLGTLFEMVTSTIQPVLGVFMQVSSVIADFLMPVFMGFYDGILAVAGPVIMFIRALADRISEIIPRFKSSFDFLSSAIGKLVRSIGDFLGPTIRLVGSILLGLFDIIATVGVPVFNGLINVVSVVVEVMSFLIHAVGAVIDFISKNVSSTDLRYKKPEFQATETPAWLKKLTDQFSAFKAGLTNQYQDIDQPLTGPGLPPAARGGGGRTYQDFRYSRFDIQQKFEEGLDPDRIAIAFAKDLGRVGEAKLESGFSPLFSIM